MLILNGIGWFLKLEPLPLISVHGDWLVYSRLKIIFKFSQCRKGHRDGKFCHCVLYTVTIIGKYITISDFLPVIVMPARLSQNFPDQDFTARYEHTQVKVIK